MQSHLASQTCRSSRHRAGTSRSTTLPLLLAIAILIPAVTMAEPSDAPSTVTQQGLQWQATTSGENLTWPAAVEHCEQLEFAGHADWRLPALAELESLHDPEEDRGTGIRKPFEIDTCCLWSGESLNDRPAEDGDEIAGMPGMYHWGLMFDGGLRYYAVHIYPDGQALCVRDMQ